MLDMKITTFHKVVELKSYTKAALALGITQPAVSQHIKKLEDHYNCKLVNIVGKSINLTPQGKALYNYTSFQLANEIQLTQLLGKIESPLKVGTTLSIASYYLPELISNYYKNPAASIAITVTNTDHILELLVKNDLDCAFVEGIIDKHLFNYHEFANAKLVPVAANNHPLANHNVDIANIQSFPLIVREEGSGTRRIFESYLDHNNISMKAFPKIIEIGSFDIIKKILQKSNAISFMYAEVAAKEVAQGDLTYLNVSNCEINRNLHFIYPKNSLLAPNIETFYATLLNMDEE